METIGQSLFRLIGHFTQQDSEMLDRMNMVLKQPYCANSLPLTYLSWILLLCLGAGVLAGQACSAGRGEADS